MDFKTRYPDMKRWPYWVLDRYRIIFPYKSILLGRLTEIDAFDGSTTFLQIEDDISEEGNFWRSYAIEAPKGWSVRDSFENGVITWSEFFQARGWIAELTGDLELNSDTHCRYVVFSELSENVKRKLEELDASGSPYQILHDRLLNLWQTFTNWERDASQYKEDYESFVKEHGHRLVRKEHSTKKLRAA